MRVYIAGPMRKKVYYNFDAFLSAEAELLERKAIETEDGELLEITEIINPARIELDNGFDPYALPEDHDWDSVPPGHTMEEYMSRDLPLVMKADAVFLLPGWQTSKGAVAEAAVAVACGKVVIAPQEGVPHSDVLIEALTLTRGDRQAQYGPPDQDFRRTADMWTALFEREFAPHEVAMAMACLKLSRLTHSLKRDSVVDLAGYARCLDVCVRENGGYVA